jgi:DNA-binding transcriptional LysR family regulator
LKSYGTKMYQPNYRDLRVALAVARSGSLRKAARQLQVSHATVSRHLADLESGLGVRLFERLGDRYVATGAGEDICAVALRVEEEVSGLSRRIAGRDQSLTGIVRVTAPAFLVEPVLMPALTEFCDIHQGIEIQVVSGLTHMNLSKREADLALRVCSSAPADLVGYRLADLAFAVYGIKSDLERCRRREPLAIVAEDDDRAAPAWWPAKASGVSRRMRANDPSIALSAIRSGLGIGRLACCVGDRLQELHRLPPPFAPDSCGLWLLTHRDLRHTARIRAFLDFMTRSIRGKRDLLEGHDDAHRGSSERDGKFAKG